MIEVYKPVFEFENYEVSNLGNVRSKTKNGYKSIAVQVRKKNNRKQPTHQFVMIEGNKTHSRSIGKMVAILFISNPENHKEIIYKDGNSGNYSVSNIEWVDNYTYMCYCMGNPNKYTNQNILKHTKKTKKREDAILYTENSIKQSIKFLRYLKTNDTKYLMDILNENKNIIFHTINGFFKSEAKRNEMYSQVVFNYFDAAQRNIINGGLNLSKWLKSTAKNACLNEYKRIKPLCLYGVPDIGSEIMSG